MNYRSLTNWILIVIISFCITSCVSSGTTELSSSDIENAAYLKISKYVTLERIKDMFNEKSARGSIIEEEKFKDYTLYKLVPGVYIFHLSAYNYRAEYRVLILGKSYNTITSNSYMYHSKDYRISTFHYNREKFCIAANIDKEFFEREEFVWSFECLRIEYTDDCLSRIKDKKRGDSNATCQEIQEDIEKKYNPDYLEYGGKIVKLITCVELCEESIKEAPTE